MPPVTEGAGVRLAYQERGSGPLVLIVHGMADDAQGQTELVETLCTSARVVAYDRRGYGGSGTPEPYDRTTVEEQAEDAAALLRGLDDGPAVLWGADFGALVCLDLCKRHAALVGAAVLVDPPLFAFSGLAAEALAHERAALEQALRDDGPEAAVAAYVDGRGRARMAAARSAPRAFFADFGGLTSWPVTRGELRALAMPLAVVTAPNAPGHVREAAEAVLALAPAARREDARDPTRLLRSLLAGAA
ncbi:MAG: alpha/beta hydrolase [Actinomycetota bacterium]|nr:alpha/beta hydrolase [Actinomycetota bacterium]